MRHQHIHRAPYTGNLTFMQNKTIMKTIFIAFLICCIGTTAQAQLLKKIKGQFNDKLKEKVEQKKNQKIDEKADKAASKVVNAPDSVIQKAERKLKEINETKKDSLRVSTEQKSGIPDDPGPLAAIFIRRQYCNI
jgi:hypothetical protein